MIINNFDHFDIYYLASSILFEFKFHLITIFVLGTFLFGIFATKITRGKIKIEFQFESKFYSFLRNIEPSKIQNFTVQAFEF